MDVKTLTIITLLSTLALACPDEKNCLGCKSETEKKNQCAYCEFGFFNGDSKKCDFAISRKIDHCREYLKGNAAVCSVCEWGFDVGTNDKGESICIPCTKENCAQCIGSSQQCTACFGPSLLIKKEDFQGCEMQQEEKFPNCKVSQNNKEDEVEKCLQCIDGFMLTSKQQCVKDKFGQCWWGEEKESLCRTCHWGHYLANNGTCITNELFPENKSVRREIILLGVFLIFVILAAFLYCFLKSRKTAHRSYETPILQN